MRKENEELNHDCMSSFSSFFIRQSAKPYLLSLEEPVPSALEEDRAGVTSATDFER